MNIVIRVSVLLLIYLISAGNIFSSNYNSLFSKAYQENPVIPKGILEAIAYSKTRIQHINPEKSELSCIGLPQAYGVMGLIKDGKGYFNNNLKLISSWSGYSEDEIISNPEKNILAFAATYSFFLDFVDSQDPSTPEYQYHILKSLSELPSNTDGQIYALDSEIYLIMLLLSDNQFMKQFGYEAWNIDFISVFGEENLNVLSSKNIVFNQSQKTIQGNGTYYSSNKTQSCLDYSGATWSAASSSNYSSRSGTAISAVTMHTVQGSYSGCISWFQNSSASVSAHYVVRSYDGQVTQMVCEADKAWHVGTENPYTIGIEQEGYVDDPAWYTNALYQSSANIVKDIISSGYGIEALSAYDGPSSASTEVLSSCYAIKGHQHFPNQSHTDPGEFWDWPRFFELINGSPSVTNYTSCSGSFKDPGGNSDYSDWEREYYLIEPSGANSVTLSFSSFDLENDYDYLHVYDGDNQYGALLGSFTGSTMPSVITASSGKMFILFTSDCSTEASGWSASWSCSTVATSCEIPSNLNVSDISMDAATLNWTGANGAKKYIVNIKRSIEAYWNTYSTTSTSLDVSGLSSNAIYEWQVAAYCGYNDTSAFLGSSFNTISPASKTTTECSGSFYDSGGDDGSYTNYEDYTYTIAPSGAISLSITFTSFSVESNYDYLYVYDGANTSGTYLGTYTGTNSPGTINSSSGALTFRFTSDVSTVEAGWKATWTCTSDTTKPTTDIYISGNWQTTDFTAYFNDADNNNGSGIDNEFYQVLDYDGSEWRANAGNGFLYDEFSSSSLNAEWTVLTGNWNINASSLYQSDESNTNTNLYASLTQTNNNTYLYSWNAMMDGSGTNRRSGMHIFCDDPTTTNRGNSYLIWPRLDDQELQIYKVTNDVLSLETYTGINIQEAGWYNYKVIFNAGTGEMNVYIDDELIINWTDASPFTTGEYISLRTGDALVEFDNIKVYQSRGGSVNVTIGGALTDDVRYQNPNSLTPSCKIKSIVKDESENFSLEEELDINIDWTNPSTVSVIDSLIVDKDTMFVSNKISATWNKATDSHSDISNYEYALGTSPGSDDVVGWANNNIKKYALVSTTNLNTGSIYYFSVKTINGAGLESISSSDGFVYLDPYPITGIENIEFENNILVYPNPFSEKLFISFILEKENPVTYSIFNIEGKIVYSNTSNCKKGNNLIEINNQFNSLPKGMYFLTLEFNNSVNSFKLILR
jgi:N-acetyl-anhydromuramyl-L-alanine amidase AmpD